MFMLTGHQRAVRCLTYSPDGAYVVSGGDDGTVRLWDLGLAGEIARLEAGTGVEVVGFDPPGQTLLCGTIDGTVIAWSAADPREGRRAEVPPGEAPWVHDLFGLTFCYGPRDRRAVLLTWNAECLTEPILAELAGSKSFAQSWDRERIAYGLFDGKVHVLQLHLDHVLRTTLDRDTPALCLAFAPDDSILAIGGPVGEVVLWDLAAGEEKTRLKGHSKPVYGLGFTPDGRTLVSAGDSTLRVWDLPSGRGRSFRWHASSVTCLAVSPDGMTAAAGGNDGLVVVWDLSEGL